jgi:hypothetical protein
MWMIRPLYQPGTMVLKVTAPLESVIRYPRRKVDGRIFNQFVGINAGGVSVPNSE